MATYTARINGVDRAETHVLLEGFTINEITNGVNTLVCRVASEDASYRPVKRQSIEIEEDDGTSPVRLIFAGTLRMVREHGWGMTADGDDAIILELSADSYRTLASRRFVTETIPAGTLKAALQVLVTYLQDFGAIGDVTLDPAQVNGPTLDAIEFKVVRVDDCLNFLATLTAKYGAPYTWTIGYDKVLGMYQTGTVAAPWNLLESEFTTLESSTGDIEVEPTDDNYANKITVVWGNGNVTTTTDTFTGDGTTRAFGPLTYQLVGPIQPFTQTSPFTPSAVGYAYVDETPPGPPTGRGALGLEGTPNMDWWFDPVTGIITKITGSPPALGALITIQYDGLVTGTVIAQDAAEIATNGVWEDKILAPEIEDPVLAQTVADAELARRVNTGRVVRFLTRRMPGPQPGETITITVPKRNISGTFTVTDVSTENEPGNVNALIRRVTCNSTIHEQSHQTLTRWWSEKDTAGISLPAGSAAVPDWPVNSVQFNDNWTFGGAAHVLYGDLFYSQPDSGETQSKGLVFVQNQDTGDAGHIGLTDPQRLEMGMIGEGDFSMDMFGVDASILMNATGDIVITAGVDEVGSPQGLGGGVQLNGNVSITEYAAALSGTPPAVEFLPQPFGDSYTRLHNLNVLDGLCGFYQTISALPYTVNTTTASDTNEFLAFISTAGTGTVFLPVRGTAGTPNRRMFPITAARRLLWFYNESGTMTLDAATAGGTTIGGDASITLGPKSSVLIMGHDTEYKLFGTSGTVTGGGASTGGGTPGGPINAVQYNNPLGTFDGEAAFTYDEAKNQLVISRDLATNYSPFIVKDDNGLAGAVAISAFNDQLYADIAFGMTRVNGVTTAHTYAPSYLWHFNAGGSGVSPDNDAIGIEIFTGEDPGSPLVATRGRGIDVSTDGIASVYQYGGLGTGGFTGCGLEIDNNTDGNGAAAYLGLKTKDDTLYYIWVDATGTPRISTAPPQEDGTPSDTSGTEFCLAPCGGSPGGSPSGGDWTFVEEVSPSGTGTLTFSSLGAYTHLKIIYAARGTEVATATSISIRFNGDTGSNYDGERVSFTTTTSAGDQVAQTSAFIGIVPGASAPSSYASGGEITIHDYRGTTFFKTAHGTVAGAVLAQSTTNIQNRLHVAFWRDTSAVTSITLLLTAGNYVAGSKFTLYGLT